MNENELEQRLIVSYCINDRDYQKAIRQRQITRAEKIVNSGQRSETRNQNSPKRFVSERNLTADGEDAEKKVLSLDSEKIQTEAQYDGFYAVCTTLEKEI